MAIDVGGVLKALQIGGILADRLFEENQKLRKQAGVGDLGGQAVETARHLIQTGTLDSGREKEAVERLSDVSGLHQVLRNYASELAAARADAAQLRKRAAVNVGSGEPLSSSESEFPEFSVCGASRERADRQLAARLGVAVG